MLPLYSYAYKYVVVDSDILHGLLMRCWRRTSDGPPENEIPRPALNKTDVESKRKLWESYFNLNKADRTDKRKFRLTMKTDGYGVSISLDKPNAGAGGGGGVCAEMW